MSMVSKVNKAGSLHDRGLRAARFSAPSNVLAFPLHPKQKLSP